MAEAGRSRSVDRLIGFTDGVVAVAITLLALPLVDLRPQSGESVWSMMNRDVGPFIAFVFTFAVVAIMWSAHNRVLNGIRDYDGAVFWLNTAWLAAIVLLPWFSAMYGESQMLGTGPEWPGAGVLYWGAMAVISLIAGALTWYLHRHQGLLVEPRPGPLGRTAWRSPVFGGYFLIIAAASVVAPQAASWLPLGIIPLSIWLRPDHSSRTDRPIEEST